MIPSKIEIKIFAENSHLAPLAGKRLKGCYIEFYQIIIYFDFSSIASCSKSVNIHLSSSLYSSYIMEYIMI